MGQKLNKFILLMWKNFMLQWRHPFQTLVEILAPILFSSLMVLLRSLVSPELHSAAFYLPFQNAMANVSNIRTTIAWAPHNPYLESIMNNTIEGINMIHNTSNFNHFPLTNREELDAYLNNDITLFSTFAGIQFNDSLEGDIEPTPEMSITFRFRGELRTGGFLADLGFNRPDNWRTHQVFPVYQMPGPRAPKRNEGGPPSYQQEGFLMLQQELSFSIIDHFKRTVKGLPFNRSSVPITMQRFPHPKYTEDMLLTALQMFVGLIFMLSFVYTCISLVKIITTEKEKQLKEAMKIMGLPNWLHWTAWFVKSFIMLIMTLIIMVALLKAKWYPGTNYTIFTHSDPFVLFIFLATFSCATITFCFLISVFFTKANTAATVAGVAWFLSYFPYMFLQDKYDTLNLTQKILASLCSNTAMAYGFQIVVMLEGIGDGLQWHNMWSRTTPDDELVIAHIMLMLVLDTIIYLLIAIYVEAVFPGEYGVPQPWYFPLSISYWCGKCKYVNGEYSEKPLESEYYEKEPTHLQAGIKIKDLRKKFGKKVAVRDLSLNMFKDQITVLLGHNGAGKTTTMSMLTGMFPPSSGTAEVGGHDIRTDMAGVRSSLGLCPQHNILFDELTVKEHLYFYCRLKGLEKPQAKHEIRKYVELLDLGSKKNALSATLSGGMKRKLSVGIALCGDSKVVMCDEPTAGMDPSARRVLWDLLQSQKKGRTILLSTHFMDEADLLGDRIAIMAGGKLQCCGSSFFLKKKYGAGYHLILDKSPQCNVAQITNLLRKYIPTIQVENNIGSELTYILNEEYSHLFEEALGDLERRSGSLGVLSYGVSLTTLEEVFMKVGADHGQEEANNEGDNPICQSQSTNGHGVINHGYEGELEATNKHVNQLDILENCNGDADTVQTSSHIKLDLGVNLLSGWALWRNQLLAMFMKRGLSILRTWVLFLIQNLIPILFLSMAIIIVKGMDLFRDLPRLKVELDRFIDPVTVITHYRTNDYYRQYIKFLQNDEKKMINWQNESMQLKIINETEINSTSVHQRYITGATFNEDNSITAWFNNQPYHSAPLALQMVMNAVLGAEVDSNYTLQMFNYPLPFTVNTKFQQLNQGGNMGFQIAFNIGFSMAFVSSFYVMFYVRERISKSKHLQFVSGAEVVSFWFPSFICDMITFVITSAALIATLAVFQEEGFKTTAELARTFALLICFGFGMLPMTYLASYFYDIPSTGYTKMTLINIFTGVAAFLVIQVLTTRELELLHVSDILHWIFLLVPHYSLSSGMREMNVLYSTHKLCDMLIDKCTNFEINGFPNITFPPPLCKLFICIGQIECCSTTKDYFDMQAPGIGRNIVYTSAVGVFLIAILLFIEYGTFEKMMYYIQNWNTPSPPPIVDDDSDVSAERETIGHALSTGTIGKYNLAMYNVTKYYQKFLAVNNLTLGVKDYECFGLLGVNGAGKTTTFKMMTGDIKLSSGEAWVNGFNLRTDIKRINQLIGYCPQFDALLDDLTCQETLIIFGLLRGVTRRESKIVAEQLARQFDFHRHLKKQVKQLSGGNKRKLSTALALIGDPSVLYLDEPTTGMDPATKRYLWDALCKVRDSGKCIVLTSHSMEECEALCTRLAIMVNGVFKCLGSTQHLKSKFSKGYILTIKVRKTEDHSEQHSSAMDLIEKFVTGNFSGVSIREKHQELVTFYITDKSKPWSKMFGIMESGKKQLHIEDYSLGQCTLEQVFLTFTKHQRDV